MGELLSPCRRSKNLQQDGPSDLEIAVALDKAATLQQRVRLVTQAILHCRAGSQMVVRRKDAREEARVAAAIPTQQHFHHSARQSQSGSESIRPKWELYFEQREERRMNIA